MTKRKFLWFLVSLLIFTSYSYGFEWKELTNSDLKKWSDAIVGELDKISKDVPPSQRDGYYWYIYGTMKASAYCVRERIIFVAQEQLENASLACKGVYSKNQATICRTNITKLKTISSVE